MREHVLKGIVAAVLAAASAYFEVLAAPLVIVVAVMLCDYLSGVAVAWVNRGLSSRVGIVGIIKKAAYVLLIGVGIAVDWTIRLAGENIGFDVAGVYYFGLLVTVWLIINECISVLENLSRLGVPVPGFLKKLMQKLKENAEGAGE